MSLAPWSITALVLAGKYDRKGKSNTFHQTNFITFLPATYIQHHRRYLLYCAHVFMDIDMTQEVWNFFEMKSK